MSIATKPVRYEHGGVAFEAFAAWDDTSDATRPIVLVASTVMGRSRFEEGKARSLAELGYVGVAIDLYGVDKWTTDMEKARVWMDALNADRGLLRDRLLAALQAARDSGAPADPARVAAIGFCFGGKCVLDLARSGADVAGVASFHGLYDAPPFPHGDIKAKILVLHGWDDPLDPPETVLGLARELTEAGADWQINSYGHTVHAFTNPAREGMYNPDSDRRSWLAMRNFLEELFG
ncbi:dienelactone hydrolase family protein [Rhizorhabdus dicambivorans]|uniref:Carboxymethylenebutenolidase n=1 Tax=Rhizorhabdus dicambivorans TaxID=1850238 RepID=A0A2A4G153_9SPHN|nr:dienelactone hydrolase family protein [Rhizorhabdus dicambivorans]ATE67096.1 carboxymethylenebutenolidase [Rhizorhabdus dicambivorans]PCE43715.1 carboxymethylenebutenolidase [Rhizorhabdus dicambivorans]